MSLQEKTSIKYTFLTRTTAHQTVPPPVNSLTAHWIAWDESLHEGDHYHLAITSLKLYQEAFSYIGQLTFVVKPGSTSISCRCPTSFMPLVSFIAISCDCKRTSSRPELLEETREYTGRLMEWVASRDPSMAAPFHLLLQPADLIPETGPGART